MALYEEAIIIMGKVIYELVILLLFLLAASCTTKHDAAPTHEAQSQKTQLSMETVISMANAEAEKQGYKLEDYLPPNAIYESSGQANTWKVIYEGKVKSQGNYFLMFINDKSGVIKLIPGEKNPIP
jgi:hypothetical protein